MNENIAPIPAPDPNHCPHCGREVPPNVELCGNCGTRLRSAAAGGMGCTTIGCIVVLSILAVPFALMGACFLFFGVMSGTANDGGWQLGGVGLLFLALAVACGMGIRNITRK
jgi:hypothetical protein